MSPAVHYRRCHVCDHTNESHQPVLRCEHCGKPLSPFFYFDEKAISPVSDAQKRAEPLQGEYKPILGLTAFWDRFK